MLIVYSLLSSHPASTVCEQFIRNRTGWLTTTFTLFEAKTILTKVYSVDPALASQKLAKFAASSILVSEVDLTTALASMQMADTFGIDLTDAALLKLSQLHGASWLATEDNKLAQACKQIGITSETPIDAILRQQMATWEAANLSAKDLSRVLRHIYQWLIKTDPQTAQDFWSQTGGGGHLP
ncbi:MAG: type II toxin-antitoxin system VapC family toxin [bacterium]